MHYILKLNFHLLRMLKPKLSSVLTIPLKSLSIDAFTYTFKALGFYLHST